MLINSDQAVRLSLARPSEATFFTSREARLFLFHKPRGYNIYSGRARPNESFYIRFYYGF